MVTSVFSSRLKALEANLQNLELDGFWLTQSDRFLNEFVPESDQCLAWITGFTGSAGLAILGATGKHALFVDSRYTLQAAQEVEGFEILPWRDEAILDWVKTTYKAGDCLGMDAWCHSVAASNRYQALLEPLKIGLQALDYNPIHDLWDDRPLAPATPFETHSLLYAGQSTLSKRQAILDKDPKPDAWLLTANTSLAWLLNLRGNDIPYTPVNRCYGILFRDGTVELFVSDVDLLSKEVVEAIQPVRLYTFDDLPERMHELDTQTVAYDATTTPYGWIQLCQQQAPEAIFIKAQDPCLLSKARKNTVELEQTTNAHLWEGVAWAKWLYWLHTQANLSQETEYSVSEKLETFRREHTLYKGPSFQTIAGFGPNGAIVHYHPTQTKAAPLGQGLLLVDAGGQYQNGGTTDTTRTIALGRTPTLHQQTLYTCVLKGHIAVARAIFPQGTTGAQLDSFARQFLWEAGYDYGHSTGHGVGSFLGVHEGPQGISTRNTTPLEPGMLLSNEPGYYEADHFGIRLENVVQVVPHEKEGFLTFRTLTLIPFDASLILDAMLTPEEREWLTTYHQRILTQLEPHLPQPVHGWLKTTLTAN